MFNCPYYEEFLQIKVIIKGTLSTLEIESSYYLFLVHFSDLLGQVDVEGDGVVDDGLGGSHHRVQQRGEVLDDVVAKGTK